VFSLSTSSPAKICVEKNVFIFIILIIMVDQNQLPESGENDSLLTEGEISEDDDIDDIDEDGEDDEE
jgi:hypothetical protein